MERLGDDCRNVFGRQCASYVRLFWKEGKLLTEEQIPESHKYRSQFYGYPKKMKDPADMDDRYIAELKSYTSKEARRNGAISSPVFFDTLYDASSQESIENRLTRILFLGRRMTVHEKIAEPLARVEKSIYHKRIWNADVRVFLHDLASCDCYHWREIRDSSSRSFHSYAIAVDVLPEGWGNKIVYWNWERNRNPDWMLVPISKRWCPRRFHLGREMGHLGQYALRISTGTVSVHEGGTIKPRSFNLPIGVEAAECVFSSLPQTLLLLLQ